MPIEMQQIGVYLIMGVITIPIILLLIFAIFKWKFK
jgi:hypothetical protein